ncbi:GNAT family N-acetyltransferase [Vibrio cyclitrophicus]|uniref:GNAT family N-acetyltransferase n=1 Tax=Vibrio cyclitrophicus TaxID=47951 RepID=UPI0002DA3C4C|nr:GNAT family N-acetyltransferase [Vibrio cyclitrophicus]KNH11763.1 acetyltransferase [Vibrio lentus]NOH20035.1 GNAT family N-acetyltransferase [Vibrio cyclitrophicus]NOH45175.1 GNAT family N-acetyltransferase [Vibrio cyclitrophicus]NOI33276.1 GNAT family N-acetyltransferase [Vibrio cyclitrophicus]OED68481.1 GNAT family N-acetyltransferase [Vibrio cyclitrophicus ZF99]|tara:strand:- start:96 stop:530 length:435 start_codon:yes stop_codon:yes gene_type:complete
MSIIVREGSLEEVVSVVEQISEFAKNESVASLAERLAGKKSLILVAEDDDVLLGFKIGYALDQRTFYSWFGGVSPLARNKGVAQAQLEAQEAWVQKQGYEQLKVKSRNQFPAMLRLLLRNGYLIEKLEEKEDINAHRIHFLKQI